MDASPASRNDEIDLVELLQALWSQKWLITLLTVLVTACAAGYAFLSKPVYEARVAVLPPALSDIAGFNLGRINDFGLKPFSIAEVYAVFTHNLQSDKARRRFFKEVYLPSLTEDKRTDSQDRLYKRFLEELSIKAPDKNQPDRYLVTVERHNPEQAAEWVNLYIGDVARESMQQMLENARSENEVEEHNIQQRIKSLRETAHIHREDRIIQLKESLLVATAVGLENPPVITGQLAQQLSAIMDGSLMYMRGAKALRAEIQSLEKRTSDDPFINNLRTLEERYDLYRRLQIDPKQVAIFRLDGEIETPDAPIKPKKALILALGVVVGGIHGLFIALIRLMLKKRSAVA